MLFATAAEADKLPTGSLQKALQNRLPPSAKALACIRALVNDPKNPQVTEDIADWAIWMVRYSNHYKMRLVGEKVSHGSSDKARQAVLARLKKAGLGAEDGLYVWVPRYKLTNGVYAMCNLKNYEREAVLTGLEKTG